MLSTVEPGLLQMTSKVLTMGVGILPLLKLTPVPSHFGGCFRLQRTCSLRGKEGEQLEARALELGCLGSKPTSALSSHTYISHLQRVSSSFTQMAGRPR